MGGRGGGGGGLGGGEGGGGGGGGVSLALKSSTGKISSPTGQKWEHQPRGEGAGSLGVKVRLFSPL